MFILGSVGLWETTAFKQLMREVMLMTIQYKQQFQKMKNSSKLDQG
jgi:hypothetical protein